MRRVLHLGSYQPVLEDALVAEVARVRETDALQPIVVLAPTFLLCRHLPRVLATKLPRGHAGVRFRTFAEIARDLAERSLRSEGLSPLPDGAESVLWKRAVAALPEDGFFAPLRDAHGFPAAARGTVRDLKDAGITPEVIARQAKGNSRLERKLRDLVAIWRVADGAMNAAGFHDDLDLLNRAAHLLDELSERGDEHPALEGCAAFLYGFYDLTRAQRRLVQRFLQRPNAVAFLPWSESDEFDYAGPTRDFLQGTLELMPEEESVAEKPRPRVRVIAAPGEARESMEVARTVASAPGALRETGVLMRVPATQAPLLDSSLGDADIPRYLTAELPLRHLPSARALRLLLEARRNDFPRTVLMELVTTAPMRFETLLGDLPITPGIWDVLTREWGVVSGASEWHARIQAGLREAERDLSRASDEDGTRAGAQARFARATALAKLIATMVQTISAIPEHGTWRELAESIRLAFEKLLDAGAELPHVRAVLARVASVEALGGDLAKGTLAEAVDLVEDALSSPMPADDSFEGEGVLVADLMKARGLPFRTAVVPGMIEGVFPRVARPDPLLGDFERRMLNRELSAEPVSDEQLLSDEDLGADGPLPLKGASASEERLLFRLCVDAARDEIVFTLPRIDAADGRERVPSWLLFQLLARGPSPEAKPLETMTLDRFRALPEVTWLPLDPAPALAITALERDLAILADALERMDPAAAATLLARTPWGRSVLAAEKNRWGTRAFTRHDGWLDSNDPVLREAVARVAFRPGREISPTRLEKWARCPYQYFLAHGLSLDPLEEPERRMTIDPRDRGDIVHRVLEKFWRSERETGRLPLSEADLDGAFERLNRVLDDALSEFESNGITGPAVLWDAEKREIAADLRAAVRETIRDAEGFVPAEFELGFGDDTAPLPAQSPLGAPRGRKKSNARQMTLAFAEPAVPAGAGPVDLAVAGGETFRFRGRIDRVDLGPDATGRVVDYKTGRASIRFTTRSNADAPKVFNGGTALQLPIYVLAAKRRFPEVKQWRAIYDYCTRRGKFTREEIAVDDEVLARLSELVRRISEDAANGRFPFIADESKCRVCDFREVCGPGHEVAFDTKKDCAEFAGFAAREEEFR